MISLCFKEFRNGNYTMPENSGETVVYVLKNPTEVLYVGITSQDVWARWFGFGGHLVKNVYGEWVWFNQVGRVIVENAPESDDYTIEIWTIPDCIEFLRDVIDENGFNPKLLSAQFIEPFMIDKLQPSLNVTFNRHHKMQKYDQEFIKAVNELYDQVFNRET